MLKVRDGIRLRDLADALDFCKLTLGSDPDLVCKFMFTVADLRRKTAKSATATLWALDLFCVQGEGQRVYLFKEGLGMRQRMMRNE